MILSNNDFGIKYVADVQAEEGVLLLLLITSFELFDASTVFETKRARKLARNLSTNLLCRDVP